MEITRKDIEQWLIELQPRTLNERVTRRMEIALEANEDHDDLIRYTDAAYKTLVPAQLDTALQNKLLEIVSAVPFRLNEKVVMFPAIAKEQQPKNVRNRKSWIAAAACVAFGSILALVLPNSALSDDANKIVKLQPVITPSYNSTNIAASSFNSNVANVEDRGVIWNRGSQPMRIFHIEYQDNVLVREPSGLDRQLTLPREEVIIIPEKID